MTDKQWKDLKEAAETVCNSDAIDRVDGKGFKVYRVGSATVRVDINLNKEN